MAGLEVSTVEVIIAVGSMVRFCFIKSRRAVGVVIKIKRKKMESRKKRFMKIFSGFLRKQFFQFRVRWCTRVLRGKGGLI